MKKCASLSNLENLSELLQLIAEPHRLKILCLLSTHIDKDSWICVSEITKQLQEPQNLISHHLWMLKRTQLISVTRDGKYMRYRINKPLYNELREAIKTIFHCE